MYVQMHFFTTDYTDSTEIRSFCAIRGYLSHSVRSDFTGLTVAARRLRRVTTVTVTAKTANSARTNTQTCNGT